MTKRFPKMRRYSQSLILVIGIMSVLSRQARSTPPSPEDSTDYKKNHHIEITLFGQPCLLEGPFEVSTLKAIHEISPEQIQSVRTEAAFQDLKILKKSLSKIKSAGKTPPVFDQYRDRLIKRYLAQIAFAEGVQATQKNKNLSVLIDTVLPHLSGLHQAPFEALAKKLQVESPHSKTKALALPQMIAQLKEAYEEAMPADPEEEFHTAIQKLKISYNCSFDEATHETAP